MRDALEYAEYDGADKGDCHIRGNNAQFADESHGETPWFTSLSANAKASKPFRREKVSLAVYPPPLRSAEPSATWLKIRKNNALMSL
jgi:hypothetical protein